MNIFKKFSEEIRLTIHKNQKKLNLNNLNDFKGITVESPPSEFNFDLSCNIALVLGQINKLNPKNLAEEIKKVLLTDSKYYKEIQVAGPGFLNIMLKSDSLKDFIKDVFDNKETYGSSKKNNSYNIEFVSANPTGPMHVGHCRGAIYGDVLASLLKFNGNDVTKEYYINDYGNQINMFVESVFLRIKEIKYKEKFLKKEGLYPGQYIIDIAENIIKDNPTSDFNNFKKSYNLLKKASLENSMDMIKNDLKKLGVHHDNFFSETDIVNDNLVSKTVKKLKENNYVEEGFLEPPKGEEAKNWKKSKRLIFKSTLFGDDSDRALEKNDGSWTYFANDVAYHANKVSRKYDYLINILGADHTGYIKRIISAVSAISNNKVKLDCKVCQLVKLFKKGKPYKMSKRSGEFISVNDLLKEVNKDSIRFMMLNRSNDVELEFDFDKILEKSKDNPVFYVQYCYARINSIFDMIKIKPDESIIFEKSEFNLNDYEKKILRKIFDWPKVVETAANKYEPHRIPFYLYELSTIFHSYWSKGNENKELKFILNGKINSLTTLSIIKILYIVIENGMKILGVSLPRKM
ncbi:MAG: arginine--tRNA ligase [Pelagibacteraceae bacterium TMED287]|nr:MAG: arginine--tRNA ligase [Pelagibacteraceae bacterium TMED287]|tara:strand:- start:2426 stop:4150 length:1725 start_codon:yes stop_codon:yes gene_type:complete